MVRVWAEEMCRNNDWLASLGGDPQEHQHQPVGIEFPDLPGADCVHKFHDGPTYGYSYTWKLFERLVRERPIRDPLRDAGARADPARHHQGNPRRARRNAARSRSMSRRGAAVVLTCGGFENNQQMIRDYLPGVPYCYTSGSPYNEGDGIAMAMSVGADLWHMNNYAGPSMALKVPEIRTSFSMQALAFQQADAGRHDRRRTRRAALHRREIQDAARQGAGQRALAAAGDTVPDVHDLRSCAVFGRPALRQAPEPRLDADRRALSSGARTTAPNWRRAGSRPPTACRRWPRCSGSTRRRWPTPSRGWNRACDAGHDAEFGRTLMLEPIAERAVLRGRAVALDAQHARRAAAKRKGRRSCAPNGTPIPRLYSAGELGSIYSYLYQGTGNIGECLAFGRIAGRNAAAEVAWS